MKKKYFFCYSKALSDHIRGYNIEFITVARDPKTELLYSLYECTDSLQIALDSYKSTKR